MRLLKNEAGMSFRINGMGSPATCPIADCGGRDFAVTARLCSGSFGEMQSAEKEQENSNL